MRRRTEQTAEGAGSWIPARRLSLLPHTPGLSPASRDRPQGLRSHARLLSGAAPVRAPGPSSPTVTQEILPRPTVGEHHYMWPRLPPPRHTLGIAAARPRRGGVKVPSPSSPRAQPCIQVRTDARLRGLGRGRRHARPPPTPGRGPGPARAYRCRPAPWPRSEW